jgi:hypothetical protein
MNFGVCAVSKVFASQLSCAAHAGETEPTTKMLKNVNTSNEALFFTKAMLGEAVINLSCLIKSEIVLQKIFAIFHFDMSDNY